MAKQKSEIKKQKRYVLNNIAKQTKINKVF